MIDRPKEAAVESAPGKIGGTWVFRGSRVPVSALFENLEDDVDVGQFVQWFPGVSDAQVREVLEYVAESSKLSA